MRFQPRIARLAILGFSGVMAFSPPSPAMVPRLRHIASVGPAAPSLLGSSGQLWYASGKVSPRMTAAGGQGEGSGSGSGGPSPSSYTWTQPSQCLSDHYEVLTSLPSIMNGALVLSPSEVETTHLTVNSVFSCPFCTGLHGELGRMSDLGDKSYDLNSACSLDSCIEATPHQEVATYARSFATRGRYDAADFEKLSSEIGPSRASAVKALAWFLKWGAFGGNTILSTPSSPSLFKLIFTLYYLPLYVIIKAFSFALKAFPTKSPKVISQAIGLLLPVIAGVWFVPVGMLGVLARGLRLIKA